MFQRILVPLDGSLRSERALPIAARLARASRGALILLRIIDATPEGGSGSSSASPLSQMRMQMQLDEAQQYLTAIASTKDVEGIPLTAAALPGPVVSTILAASQTYRADLLVLCEQSRPQEQLPFIGGLAEQFIEQITIPLLVVPAHGDFLHARTHPFTLLVAFDKMQPEPALVRPAIALLAALATQQQGRLHGVYPCSLLVFPASAAAANHPVDQYASTRSDEGDLLVLGMPSRQEASQGTFEQKGFTSLFRKRLPLLLVPPRAMSQTVAAG